MPSPITPQDPGTPFRNANNRLLTHALFYETSEGGAIYTLKDHDFAGLPSLYRLYMELEDPTEYTFATSYLAGWEHWEKLCSASFFKPYVQRWRKELTLKIKARALQKLISASHNVDSKSHFTINAFLLKEEWVDTKSKKGRPSKEDIKHAAKAEADAIFRTEEDFNRIMNREIN